MSILTSDEIIARSKADIDIGAGYPKIDLPAWLREELLLTNEYSFAYTADQSLITRRLTRELDHHLLRQVCAVLGISETYAKDCFVTFSGSVGLDRAIKVFAQRNKSILIESPFIDLGVLMARESAFGRVDHLVREPPRFDFDMNRTLDAIKSDTRVILVSSPNNPTGCILSQEAMMELLQLSVDRDIVIVVDACFANINPFDQAIYLPPDFAPPGAKWVMIWDTGKTFGLNEEKLGFVFCSHNLRKDMAKSINVVQFDISRRLKLLFCRLLESSNYRPYIVDLSLLIQNNAQMLSKRLLDSGYEVLVPQAGSLLFVDISKRFEQVTDTEFCNLLLKSRKVGIVAGNSFFHKNEKWKHQFIRIALARSETTLNQACNILCAI